MSAVGTKIFKTRSTVATVNNWFRSLWAAKSGTRFCFYLQETDCNNRISSSLRACLVHLHSYVPSSPHGIKSDTSKMFKVLLLVILSTLFCLKSLSDQLQESLNKKLNVSQWLDTAAPLILCYWIMWLKHLPFLIVFVTVSIETRPSPFRLFRRETGSCGWRPWTEKSLWVYFSSQLIEDCSPEEN